VIRVLDQLVRDKYVLLYVCTNASPFNSPAFLMLKEMWKVFGVEYENNLESLLVLHPGLLFRAVFAAAWPVMPARMWSCTVYLNSLQDLERYCELKPLVLPQYVQDYDLQHFGRHGRD